MDKNRNDMAKIQLKSDKLTSFGGIFFAMNAFERMVSPIIDKTLGQRCSTVGYQYSEIFRSLMSVYLCGGTCVEDLSSHLMQHLAQHPSLRTCSADTVLRAIAELSVDNITYTADSGKSYDFNTADKLNKLLIKSLVSCGQLVAGEKYDFDFDHEFLETEKYDAKPTYKKFLGYSPGVAVINDTIVGIENRDGNANVRFHQQDTLKRIFTRLADEGIKIRRARMDCGSFSKDIVNVVEQNCDRFYIRAKRCHSLDNDLFALRGWKKVEINNISLEVSSILVEKWGKAYRLVIQRQRRDDAQLDVWTGEFIYRCILTNDMSSTPVEIIKFYNQRGAKERYFDVMNNDFGWKRLPKSFMAQNTAFLLITALIYNFYKKIMQTKQLAAFGLKPTSRVKAFVFRFISVPAKWVTSARQAILNIHSSNTAYEQIFKLAFG